MRRAASWKKPLSIGKTSKSSAILLIGKERFLKREAIVSLRRQLFPEDTQPGLNFQEFEADRDPLHSFLDFLLTAPFAANHRLAVLWGIDSLPAEEKAILMSFVETLPDSSVCMLESEQTNAKKDSFLRKLAEKAKLVPCHTPFERDLPAWVESRAKKISCSLDRHATLFLIACTGAHLAELDSALEQLSLFVHPKQMISLEDARAMFRKKSHEDVFQLAEFLHDRRPAQALRVTDALICAGTHVSEIIAALAGQWGRWKKGARGLEAGQSPAEIAQELHVPVFFQDAFFMRLKKLSVERLSTLCEALLVCDESIKRGQTEGRLALEKLIWTI
jgi:DNA polymerase-3 subunit delta